MHSTSQVGGKLCQEFIAIGRNKSGNVHRPIEIIQYVKERMSWPSGQGIGLASVRTLPPGARLWRRSGGVAWNAVPEPTVEYKFG